MTRGRAQPVLERPVTPTMNIEPTFRKSPMFRIPPKASMIPPRTRVFRSKRFS